LWAEKSADTQSVDASELEAQLDKALETTNNQTQSNKKTGAQLQVKFLDEFS
jgi:hypothetical protein